ncbi:hypothetical protein ACA851_004736 [Escherichia coli]
MSGHDKPQPPGCLLEQKGRQEGALEKALAIACQLQKMGMTPEQIRQATGLSDDELKKITH